MDERREELLSLGAIVATLLLLAAQVGLLAAYTWVPMARAAERLASPEYVEGAPEPADEQAAPGHAWWRWVAWGCSALTAGIAAFAVHRLRYGVAARHRWIWVLVTALTATFWGTLVGWLITRQGVIFQGLFVQ